MFWSDLETENKMRIGRRKCMETKKSNKGLIVLAVVGVVLLYMLIQLVIGAVVGGVVAILGVDDPTDVAAVTEAVLEATPVVQLVAGVILLAVFGLWYYFGFVKNDKVVGVYESGFKKVADAKVIGFVITLGLGCYFFTALFSEFIAWAIPGSAELLSALMEASTEGNEVAGLLYIAILGPIAEEFAFRGVALRTSRKAFGVAGTVILTAVMFGIMHMNPLQSLYAIPLGAVYAFVAYKFKSIVPTCIMHIINNSIAMILSAVLTGGINNVVCVVLAVVFIAAAIFFGKDLSVFKKEEVKAEIPA